MKLGNVKTKSKLILLISAALALALVAIGAVACTEKPPPPGIDIWTAVAQGNVDAVKQHIAAGTDINRTFVAKGVPGSGGTPLHIAALTDQKEIAELLLENGADINARAKDEFGATPLSWAAFLGNKRVVEFLVEAGADVNASDRFGFTPLDAALDETVDVDKEVKDEIADFLRANGAKTRD